MNKDKFLYKLSLLFDAHVSGDIGEFPITWGYVNTSFNEVKNNFDNLSKEDLESIIKGLYIDIAAYNHNFINDFNHFQAVITFLQNSLMLDLNDYKSMALDNKNSVCSSTLKKKEKLIMSNENKKYEYVERKSLTIPDQCITKRKDGSIVYLDKDSEGKPLSVQRVFVVLPQRNGEDFRRKFTVPATSIFPNQIKEFKTISLSKAVNKETNEEMKFIVSFEKKGEDGMWHDCSNEYTNEQRTLTYDSMVSLIKDTFKNLNATKEVDGKTMPAVHYMWLPQNAYESDVKEKNVPTIRIVPEINAKTGEKNITAGDSEITLPTYAKIHSFKTYSLNADTKEFTENKNTELFNLNFAKFYVNKTYTSGEENKEGLVGVMMPDDAIIHISTTKHEGKDGKVYEAGSYYIKASDLREAIKEDYRDYKKSMEKTEDGKSVADLKSSFKETEKATQVNTKENTKEQGM